MVFSAIHRYSQQRWTVSLEGCLQLRFQIVQGIYPVSMSSEAFRTGKEYFGG